MFGLGFPNPPTGLWSTPLVFAPSSKFLIPMEHLLPLRGWPPEKHGGMPLQVVVGGGGQIGHSGKLVRHLNIYFWKNLLFLSFFLGGGQADLRLGTCFRFHVYQGREKERPGFGKRLG